MLSAPRPGPFSRFLLLSWLALALVQPGWAAAATPRAAAPARPVDVVLVHGFTDTGAVFNRLVGTLEQQGCHCFAPSLQPNDFRFGVRDLTRKLSAEIDHRFGRSRPFVLVALSMGGLVARDYVQNLGHGRRVQAFFEISTANQGTIWANFSPGGGVRDFAVGSPFLRALNADVSAWKPVPVYAYWTPFDLAVVPSVNTKCVFGQTKRILAPFHQSMVKNPEVITDIAAKIDGLVVRPFARAGNAR